MFKNVWNVKPLKKKTKQSNAAFKPMKVKTIPIVKQKRKPLPKRPNKNLSYPQAKMMFGKSLAPFGNWDKDAHLNMFDCRPFDRTRHAVPEEYAEYPVYSYVEPRETTFRRVFADAERMLPEQFKGPSEDTYSELLTNALLERLDTGDVRPFEEICGTYEIPQERVPAKRAYTQMIHDYINEYLQTAYPEYIFHYNYEKPNEVDVEIYTKDKRTGKPVVKKLRNKKLGKYLDKEPKAPQAIRDLNKLYTTSKGVTIYITDYPVDVMSKSSGVKKLGKGSCETMPKEINVNDPYSATWIGNFDDISYRNAIAFFYLGDKNPKFDKPTARVMIRWGVYKGKVDIMMEKRIYPTNLSKFYLNFVKEIIQNKGYGKYKITTPYKYRGYGDVNITEMGTISNRHITYRPFSDPDWKIKQDKEKSIEDEINREKEEILERRNLPLPFETHFMRPQEPVNIRRKLAQRIPVTEPVTKTGLRRETIAHLARDPDEEVRATLAREQPELEPNVLQTLARGPTEVQRSILKRKDIDENIIRQLSENQDLLEDIAEREDTPKDILEKIVYMNTKSDGVQNPYQLMNAKENVAKQQNLPKDWIETLVATGTERVMTAVAKNQSYLSDEMVEKMLKQDSSEIERALAANPNTPHWAVGKLIQSPDLQVVRRIIMTFGMPKELLEYLVQEENQGEIREAIAKTPVLPLSLFKKLSEDTSFDVRSLIAQREDIPYQVANKMSTESNEEMLYNLARNPMSTLSISQKKTVLENIIRNGTVRVIHQLGGARGDLTPPLIEHLFAVATQESKQKAEALRNALEQNRNIRYP